MNWFIIIPFGIAMITLVIFLVWRNQKDEKKFEEQLKNDYTKPASEDANIDIDEQRD